MRQINLLSCTIYISPRLGENNFHMRTMFCTFKDEHNNCSHENCSSRSATIYICRPIEEIYICIHYAIKQIIINTPLSYVIYIRSFIRLGFIIDYLSKATLIGFMAGAAVIVSMQQLKGLLGIVHFAGKTQIIPVVSSVFHERREVSHKITRYVIEFNHNIEQVQP